ncbi:MAG: hypothetical protein M3350_11175 [Actinomycetota bacterium]|nr:hypothetical protein [Actinomycetota bacterium]
MPTVGPAAALGGILGVVPGAGFLMAENPDGQSTLPYLLHLPLEGDIALKARERWPTSSRVYCHELAESWPQDAQVLEEVPVRQCRRRSPAVDLLLDRPSHNRSQFVFEERPETEKVQEAGAPFAPTVLENLRKAGVQNTVREEHLNFGSLEPFAGHSIDLRGEFTDSAPILGATTTRQPR